MQEIINRVLGNNLADFEGLEISGSVPLRDAFLNEAIAGFLASLQGTAKESEATGAATAPAGGEKPSRSLPVDPQALIGLVKKVEVQSDKGVVTVRFEVRR